MRQTGVNSQCGIWSLCHSVSAQCDAPAPHGAPGHPPPPLSKDPVVDFVFPPRTSLDFFYCFAETTAAFLSFLFIDDPPTPSPTTSPPSPPPSLHPRPFARPHRCRISVGVTAFALPLPQTPLRCPALRGSGSTPKREARKQA